MAGPSMALWPEQALQPAPWISVLGGRVDWVLLAQKEAGRPGRDCGRNLSKGCIGRGLRTSA